MKVMSIWRSPIALLVIAFLLLSACAALGLLPLSRVTQVAIYALYAAGVCLLMAYTGLVPFGASVFFGCASYASALFSLRVLPGEWAGVVFGALFSAVLAVALGALILRRTGLYFSLLTLAASQIAFEVALKWTDFTGGENGIQGIPRPMLESDMAFHMAVLVVVTLCLLFVWRLVHSPFGRVLQAVRDNEQRAASIGYNTYRYKLGAFVFTGALVGVAGALQTYLLRGVYANNLGWQHAGDALLMAVLGGANHFLGPLWGAAAFILLEDRLSTLIENWWLLFAPVIIIFVLAAPQGIHGLLLGRRRHRWTLVRDTIPARPPVIRPLTFDPATFASPGTPILQVSGMSKKFGALVVAGGFDLDVHPHQLHSFIGPNGAGKTTFFNMLSGVLRPDAGRVVFCGTDITRLPLHERVALGLCRSFQIVSVFHNLTAFENVRLAVQARMGGRGTWRDAHDMEAANSRTWSVLQAVGLADHAALPCHELSHGQKRLLEIAITIATDAKLLLLDEPLAGLAEADRKVVSGLIKQLARTHAVLLIEHDIDRVLSMSDRITVLHQGRLIADGPPAEVAANPAVVAAYLGAAHGSKRERVPAVVADARDRAKPPVLTVQGVRSGYGGGSVLDGINLTVREGEVVALLGRNGVGKTTLLKTIMGTVPISAGEIAIDGRRVDGLQAYLVNRSGIAIVPEGRRLFPNLSVIDNLRIAKRPGGASYEEVFEIFPKLKQIQERRAEHLSGGERQMVAIARALMAPSRVILLDEPFEGLAPAVVQEVMDALLKLRGRTSMVLVEHHAEQVLAIADRAYVLVNGRVAYEGAAEALERDEELQSSLLGLVQPEPAKAEVA
jgi:branched-chain amino acid transport system ATP-binding protein